MSYETGYGKLPKRTQFKKGGSGNLKGRPRADHKNVGETVRRIFEETVCVTENGRRRSITKFEAAFTQLSNQAAKGDLRALKLVLPIVKHFYGESLPGEAEPLIVKIVQFGDLPEEESS
jgi:uncharacterized protein DUF5681